MRKLVFPLLSAALLSGCANSGKHATADLGRSAFYSCTLANQPAAVNQPAGAASGARSLVVTLYRDREGSRLVLNPGTGQQQMLDPVAETSPAAQASGPLFANSLFAWRVGSKTSVLTDVENVETYACRNISYAEALAWSDAHGAHL